MSERKSGLILLGVVKTEKAINLMNTQHTIVFWVSKDSNKGEIKKYIEDTYGVAVQDVRVLNTFKGNKKKAYVRFAPEVNIDSLASKLNLM